MSQYSIIDVAEYVYNSKTGNEAFCDYFEQTLNDLEYAKTITFTNIDKIIYVIGNPFAFEGRLLINKHNPSEVYACMFYEIASEELELHFMFILPGGQGRNAFDMLLYWAICNESLFQDLRLTFRAEKDSDCGCNASIMTTYLRDFVKSAAKRLLGYHLLDAFLPQKSQIPMN